MLSSIIYVVDISVYKAQCVHIQGVQREPPILDGPLFWFKVVKQIVLFFIICWRDCSRYRLGHIYLWPCASSLWQDYENFNILKFTLDFYGAKIFVTKLLLIEFEKITYINEFISDIYINYKKVSTFSYRCSVSQKREICSELVILTGREHGVLFVFLKFRVRQTFKGSSKRLTDRVPQLDLRYDNGAKTIEK